ncbi:MAG: hypothetical protein KA184_06510 [Candidatus Hydrogenedentes bacterium]|nr:hypothetical protein [Candidatus Hydrogenedentota bacterium]
MREPRRCLLIAGACAALLLARTAPCESVHENIAEANQLLDEGRYEEAAARYKDAQKDNPDLESLRYAAAYAGFRFAESLAGQNPEQAIAKYQETANAFKELAGAGDAAMRREAELGALNCDARAAELEAKPQEYLDTEDKSAVPLDEFKKRVDRLRQASRGYEQFLRQYPACAPARQNLERLRYFWKRMLQEPPESPPPVRIMSTRTDYPGAQAQPLPEEASVVLVPGAAHGAQP